MNVCKKNSNKKQRKAFDSKKKRIIDSEHAQMLKHQEIEEKKKKKSGMNTNTKIQKKKKWEKQSEEFRAIMKNNRNLEQDIKNGKNIIGKYQNNVPSSMTDDYIYCKFCTRKYNEQAYNKHLNFCEKKNKDNLAKGKMKTQTKPNLNVKFGKK